MKIVFLDKKSLGADSSIDIFNQLGEVINYDTTAAEELDERIADADAIITNKVVINAESMDKAKKLKYIGIAATGTNNVDLVHAADNKLIVTNVGGYSTRTVAQHTFALLFSVMEQLPYYDEYIKSGTYSRSNLFTWLDRPFMELADKTWGIIGLGEIGRNVAAIAKAFGCRVIYYSTSGRNNNPDYEQVDWATLLAESDVVSVHAPLNDNTRNLMNAQAFAAMKKTAYFINVGRGPIVDEAALAAALDNGEIAGAGLDIYVTEPMAEDNPLLNIKNKHRLAVTPHIAWASIEARRRLINQMYLNLKGYIDGEVINKVN